MTTEERPEKLAQELPAAKRLVVERLMQELVRCKTARAQALATNNKLRDSVLILRGGVLWILGGCWFWCYLAGNPLDELALIRRAQVATGSLVETHEHEEEDDRGHVYLSDVGDYAFRVPDGSDFKASTRVPTGDLKEQEQVEYLPDNPAVNRIKGDGCQSITEWLWRKVGLGSLLLTLLAGPGIVLLRHGVRDIRRTTEGPSS